MQQLGAKYFTRKSCLAELNTVQTATPRCVPAGDTNTYCICVCSGDGSQMLCCDNENCHVQWYHAQCVNVKRIPNGTAHNADMGVLRNGS